MTCEACRDETTICGVMRAVCRECESAARGGDHPSGCLKHQSALPHTCGILPRTVIALNRCGFCDHRRTVAVGMVGDHESRVCLECAQRAVDEITDAEDEAARQNNEARK